MLRIALLALLAAAPLTAKWPPWISIESPVNPFDPSTRGAALLVHAAFREGDVQLSDLNGSAEGIVNGARRSIPLRFESTSRPNVFGVSRQWPGEGTWLLRIALRGTTALVSLDRDGRVASVQVPTVVASGTAVPRAVGSREVDSTLSAAARR